MIYLNHAATSWPKPASVTQAYCDCLKNPPAGQFRSARQGEGGDLLNACRQSLGKVLGVEDWRRIFFTSGATDAANWLISGLDWRGKRVLLTATEHNSVLRPLYNHPDRPEIVVLPCDAQGVIAPETLKNAPEAAALFLNHCSNVTGAIQDVAALGKIAREKNMPLILDASQSAGCIPVHADDWGVDALFFTGHKGLVGPPGTGGFFARETLRLCPSRFGGTGEDSARLVYENNVAFEVGTQNLPAIAALNAALCFLPEQNVVEIQQKESALMDYLLDNLKKIPHLRVYAGGERQGPLASFTMDGLAPSDIAYILQNAYDIVTRAGLHCAPLIHEYIGTAPEGTLRVSIGQDTRQTDIDALLTALRTISQGLEEGKHAAT